MKSICKKQSLSILSDLIARGFAIELDHPKCLLACHANRTGFFGTIVGKQRLPAKRVDA